MVTGVDQSAAMVAPARAASVDAVVASVEHLPFADGAYDAVVGGYLLNHLARPEVAVAELGRVLRAGGRLALTVWDVPDANPALGLFGPVTAEVGLPDRVPPGPDAQRFTADDAQTGSVHAPAPARTTPRASRTRLAGVDAARGLAVLGMVAVHVLPGENDDGSVALSEAVAGGRSSAAFAVLAGVGVALASRGTDRGLQRVRLVLRALLIGALGLQLGGLDTSVAVILAYYAVFFLLLLPFLGWPPRRLLLTAAGVALVVPQVSFLVRPHLDGLAPGNPTWSSLADPVPLVVDLLITGVYPAVPWLTYLLTGLAVGRLALDRPATAARIAAAGAALAVGAAAVSELVLGPLGGYAELAELAGRTDLEEVADLVGRGYFGNVPTDSAWFLAVDAHHSSTTPDLVATTGTALLALGTCLLLSGVAGPLLTPLAAVGSMPLTVYSLHLWVLHVTDSDDPTRYYLLQVGTALVVAPLWRRLVGRGPLEAALAAVSRTVRARR